MVPYIKMALLNDIKRMQSEGRTDQEIIAALKEQGITPREITEALTQSKIKEAITDRQEEGYEASIPAPQQAESMSGQAETPYPAQPAEMAPSMTQPEGYAASAQLPAEVAQYPAQPAYQEYPQQQYPQGGISPDTITEISEQVVAEKLSTLREDIEKIIDMKTTVEPKIEYLDERLKRIEKIIDRFQLSIMQKVGDYMTNIDDIKKELIETQKSFKALNPRLDLAKDKSKKQQFSQE